MGKNRARKRRLLLQQQQKESKEPSDATSVTKDSNTDSNQDSEPKQKKEKLQAEEDKVEPKPTFPIRDISSLYAPTLTYECATESKCVSCAYKCACFDVALDCAFTSEVPNVRPETCPRSVVSNSDETIHTSAFQNGMNVLTVGDGDFSFSLAIARQILTMQNDDTKTEKSSSNVVATSYEDEKTLRRVYPNFDDTLKQLKQLGAQVLFKVDATRLHECADLVSNNQSFHRIVWNFPCAAVPDGLDGQNKEMDHNRSLVQTFVEDVLQHGLIDEHFGEIHMAHKTKPPYNQWELEKLVLSASETNPDLKNIDSSKGNEKETTTSVSPDCRLAYDGRIVLDKCLFSPYIPRKALDKKSFSCHDACIYIFRIISHKTGTGSSPGKDIKNNSIFQSTIPADTILMSKEECIKNEGQKKQLVPMTIKNIKCIRDIHLLQAEQKSLQKKYGLDKFYSKQLKKNKKTKN